MQEGGRDAYRSINFDIIGGREKHAEIFNHVVKKSEHSRTTASPVMQLEPISQKNKHMPFRGESRDKWVHWETFNHLKSRNHDT